MTDDEKPGDEEDILSPDEEVVVEADDEAPAAEAAPPEDAAEVLKRQLAEMTAKADDERKRREEAERRAAERDAEATKSNRSVEEARRDWFAASIETRTRDADRIEAELAAALAEGDFARAAKAQRDLNKVQLDIGKLEDGKSALEAQIKAPLPEVRDYSDFEGRVRQFTAPTQAWFRKHPEYLTEPGHNAQAQRAHHSAIGEGLAPDTAAYFEFVERRLGLRPDADVEAEPAATPTHQTQRTRPMAAAPPSRESPTAQPGTRGTRITLTAAQKEAADISGVDYVTYAKELARAEKDGQIGRPYLAARGR